jgi:Transmembrane protein 43
VDPGQPLIGDHRISFSTVPNGPASFIGRQSGADITEYQTKSGDRLLLAKSGLIAAPDMFKAAEDENRMMTWILRAVGVVAMLIGFALILFPLSVVADVVPFIGSIVGAGAFLVAVVCTFVLAPALTAVACLWYLPLVSIAVLVVGLGVAYGFRTLAARRTPALAVPAR